MLLLMCHAKLCLYPNYRTNARIRLQANERPDFDELLLFLRASEKQTRRSNGVRALHDTQACGIQSVICDRIRVVCEQGIAPRIPIKQQVIPYTSNPF